MAREHAWSGGGMQDQGGVYGRGMHGRGHAWPGGHVWLGACVARGHAWHVEWGAYGGGIHGRRDDHCSRQYASYWNAFLLKFISTLEMVLKIFC